MLEDDKVSILFLKTPYYDVVPLQSTCFEIHLLFIYTNFYVCFFKFLPS